MCGVFQQYRLDPVIRLFRSDVPDVGKAAALPVTVVTDPCVPTERLESPVGGLPPNEGEARDADGGNILRYILFFGGRQLSLRWAIARPLRSSKRSTVL